MVEGFSQNWFKKNAPEFDSLSGMRKGLAEAVRSEMIALWLNTYAQHRDTIRAMPSYLLSGSSFGVTDGARTEALSDIAYPGKRSGSDLLLEPDQWDEAFAGSIKLRALINKYDTARSQFCKEVWQVLESVNTTGKLVEIWAAAEQYIPAHLNEPGQGINLPILHTSRLDAALGVINA
jgi:hypothetical protein